MPTQIDCPECGGRGEIITADRSTYPPTEDFSNCFNPDCKDGKITVYTEEEMQKLKEMIMLNARRLHSKAWNQRTTNNWLYQQMFGVGNGTAYKNCQAMGIDPDGYTAEAIRSRGEKSEVSFEKSDH